jgi:hypothetical protein
MSTQISLAFQKEIEPEVEAGPSGPPEQPGGPVGAREENGGYDSGIATAPQDMRTIGRWARRRTAGTPAGAALLMGALCDACLRYRAPVWVLIFLLPSILLLSSLPMHQQP